MEVSVPKPFVLYQLSKELDAQALDGLQGGIGGLPGGPPSRGQLRKDRSLQTVDPPHTGAFEFSQSTHTMRSPDYQEPELPPRQSSSSRNFGNRSLSIQNQQLGGVLERSLIQGADETREQSKAAQQRLEGGVVDGKLRTPATHSADIQADLSAAFHCEFGGRSCCHHEA